MKKSILSATLALLSMPVIAYAEITLPDIVGDNMVLQQQTDSRIWGWATPGSAISVTPSWSADKPVTTKADKETGRWEAVLATPQASYDPQTITITGDGSNIDINNVLIGEVWLCSGQSNMEMPLRGWGFQPVEGAGQAIAYAGNYPGIRVATVPKSGAATPQDCTPGKWKISNQENAPEFSAVAYFFARSLQDMLNVPVGVIVCAYGGSKAESWLPREIVATYPDIDVDGDINGTSAADDWHRAVVRYNSMLYPLAGYTIKGVIWNQGESNVEFHDTYAQRMADIANHWSKIWGQGDLPFYQVEIPGWEYGDVNGTSGALLREAQHKAAKLMPKGGIVCTSDLVYPDEYHIIHARNKQPIGERLAFLAAANDYGMSNVPHIYPSLAEYSLNGKTATIKLGNVTGDTYNSDGIYPLLDIEGFEVAGDDHVFYPASAREMPSTLEIVVTAPEQVQDIKSVRYCFKNFVIGKAHSMMGLPVVPFRTDDWNE